ncbi:MAG: choice-of-anchor D domain-containing protein, partial [Granulicella sp.]
MIKKLTQFRSLVAVLLVLAAATPLVLHAQPAGPQQLVFAGLRSVARQGQFNAVRVDSAGNLYLLLDQKDGVRLLKTDAAATTVLAQAVLGAAGDVGLAMTLDPAGNVYVTGTTSSGTLAASSGAAFPGLVDTSVNSFVAKFDANLNLGFLTYGGSGHTAASAIAATADAVFITGLIYGSGLPVTPAGIMQAPVFGSSQNGFVEKFSADGTTLLYATYLSGANGDTSPTALVADASENAYIGGFTTAPGFPTVAALVPRSTAATTGFLIKLTPGGDGITFSTFLPGSGISAVAIDPSANNLLLTGTITLGAFPVANTSMPLVNIDYQTLLRMPLDGSSVLSSTVLAPGTQSSLAVAAGGVAWVDGPLTLPLLPLQPLAETGGSYALRIFPSGAQGVVDEAVRFGGLATTNPGHASLPVSLNAVAVDATGSAIFAGSAAPTASASLLSTQTFDLPLSNAPTTALPSSVRDAVAPLSCTGSLCAGSAAYLARVTPTAGASLALSTDASPNILLRNLGSQAATNLQISASGFTVASTCGTSLGAGSQCAIALGGNGPGSLTVQASNATTQTASLAAVPLATVANTLVFSPKEIDFGIQTATSATRTQTVTVTNLGASSQNFSSALVGPTGVTPHIFSESASTCATAGDPATKALAAGASCQITLGFTATNDATKDGAAEADWTIGGGNVLLTGYGQAASLSLSSSTIDFGTQFYGGLHAPRYLFLSNHSDAPIAHTPLAMPPGSPFTLTDRCPTALNPHTVCTIQFGYQAAQSTSTDSITLTLDQGLAVLVTGLTIPQPGANGSTVNPNLSVTPGPITFATPVVVTGISSSTQTVTVSNIGSSAFTLSTVLTGDFTDQTNC